MINPNTSQQGFWELVNGEYQPIQVSVRVDIDNLSPSSRNRSIGIDCTITFEGVDITKDVVTHHLSQPTLEDMPLLKQIPHVSQQDWKKGDLFIGLSGIGGGFTEGEIYKILEDVERDNMPYCRKADGSGMRMYIHTRYMGVVSQQGILVGDKVKITGIKGHGHKIGEIGEVIYLSTYDDSSHVKIGNLSQIVDNKYIEVLRLKEKRLSEGDKVKIIGNRNSITHNFRIGDVGRVMRVHHNHYSIRVRGFGQYVSFPDAVLFEGHNKPRKIPCSCYLCKSDKPIYTEKCNVRGCRICTHRATHVYTRGAKRIPLTPD